MQDYRVETNSVEEREGVREIIQVVQHSTSNFNDSELGRLR